MVLCCFAARACILERPSHIPVPSAIEMMWHDLNKALHARNHKNIGELKHLCSEEGSRNPLHLCVNLMCKSLLFASKGGI